MIKEFFLISTAVIFLSACEFTSNNSEQLDPSEDNEQTPSYDDYTDYEWQPVAGNATDIYDPNRNFTHFIPDISLSGLGRVSQGRELFVATWLPGSSNSQPSLDGVGPLKIASACSQCHSVSGRVASLENNGEVGLGLLFRLGDVFGNHDPYYGSQLQTSATSGSSEGHVSWELDASNKPIFTLTTNQLEITEGINLGPRLSPQLVGVGLLDLVSNQNILSREDEHDLNNDGISGRAHWRTINGEKILGRFGWTATQPSLKSQIAGAFNQDMGITSSIFPDEPCTSSQTICNEQPNGGNPEVSDSSLSDMNDFLTLLAVPARRISDQDEFNKGASIFDNIGCSKCHQPTLTTSDSSQYPLLANQLIYPYTDLLLHDLGEDLSDNVKEGDANPREWRTPPLWSLGLIEAVEGSRFLHDGRAATIEEAILWHGGEALATKNKFAKLSADNKETLLRFLRSI
jgi:CxxC motif-containing protein (DUF1111 family)